MALVEQVDGLAHQRFVKTLVEGEGEKDIQDALEQCVFALQPDNVLRVGEVVELLASYFHCCLSFRRFLYSSRSVLPGLPMVL